MKDFTVPVFWCCIGAALLLVGIFIMCGWLV